MGKYEKLLLKIIRGESDTTINFKQLFSLLLKLGFDQRVKGDHFIFTREDIIEIINIQPRDSQAKAYQVKQIRSLILKYNLGDRDVN
ncbi:type II toxin-antitoxin system HicA family toxin [Spirulina major]|uniref:type II toxin-antitoxin system HicA family toxin n=1 Tax=Spirulina major TaxID=270636 RepID=UPI000932F412|nr:type II toxin-antitoxin system HicA family toxin [Spirulina major]